MNSVLRILRSRFLWAALCIALEFAKLLAVFIAFYRCFVPFAILAWIFHIGVLLYIINRDDVPELKLPWIILMFLLPVLGAFVFILLSSTESSKKEARRFAAARQAISPCMRQTPAIEALRQQSMDAYAQANYLYHAAGMPCYGGVRTTYFAVGEDFHAALLKDLREAREFILMEYFIIQEGEMWDPVHALLREKAASGVEVCLMYDDFGCMTTLPEHYDAQLRGEGIEYSSSVLLETLFGLRWWDYSHLPFNLGGRICLPVLLFFASAGFLLTRHIAPLVQNGLDRVSPRTKGLCCLMLCALFFVDILLTLADPNAGVGITV